ncbi:Uncharacterised protein [Mycobacteroides abscessus subsp. abscessus]|nr:Uncharacterised protein [Mycobacteroides abscessus subsp. abscessus]
MPAGELFDRAAHRLGADGGEFHLDPALEDLESFVAAGEQAVMHQDAAQV